MFPELGEEYLVPDNYHATLWVLLKKYNLSKEGEARVLYGTGVVRLALDSQSFHTIWGEAVSPEIIQRAISWINDESIKWDLDGTILTHKCYIDPIANGIVADIEAEQVVCILRHAMSRFKAPMGLVVHYANDIDVFLYPDNSYVRCGTVYDNHPVAITEAIAIVNEILNEGDTMETKNDMAHVTVYNFPESMENMPSECLTRTYNVETNTMKLMSELVQHRNYSMVGRTLTMNFSNVTTCAEFETQLAKELNAYYDVTFRGGEVDGTVRNVMRVYFAYVQREYYFFIVPFADGSSVIFISGDENRENSAIKCHLSDGVLHVEDFYYSCTVEAKESMKSATNFRGYGPRGMLLIKYIATVMGATNVTLVDKWEHDHVIRSEELQRILQDRRNKVDNAYEENYGSVIDRWVDFYKDNDTYENAMEHGYYGGFNFRDTSTVQHEAKVADIRCAARLDNRQRTL